MIRVGHKGADAIVPGNTLASFDAALELGVDMVELDVLPARAGEPDGALVLAHDYAHDISAAPSLEEGLGHLARGEHELLVDLKLPGYEGRVAAALRERGLLERTLVSTTYMRSLVVLADAEPGLRRGWSVPRARRDYTASALTKLPAAAMLVRMRRRLPRIAAGHLRAGRCHALMAHQRLVTRELVSAVHDADGALFVWTVDDARRIAELEELGVDGVVSNDPRLFRPPGPRRPGAGAGDRAASGS